MPEISKHFSLLERFDKLSSIPENEFQNLKNNLHRQGVIHIPNLNFEPQEFINFAKKLGNLEIVRPEAHRLNGCKYIRLQSNVPGIGIQGGGNYWHSDSPWSSPPSLYTLLYCIEAPSSGGEIFFVNMVDFLRSLSLSIREKLKSLKAFYPCKSILEEEFSQMQIYDKCLIQQMKNIVRDLIQIHPVTQRKFLYLNEKWLSRILDMTAEESNKILTYLYNEIENYTNKYIHQWKTGDLLIWDNNVVKCLHSDRKITYRIIVKSMD